MEKEMQENTEIEQASEEQRPVKTSDTFTNDPSEESRDEVRDEALEESQTNNHPSDEVPEETQQNSSLRDGDLKAAKPQQNNQQAKLAKNAKRTAKSKPTKQEKLEADNLLEEASEILDNCINCGMCKALCPVFKTIREESVSPRGKAILLKEKILDKVIYQCTLCKACEHKCPLNIKVCDAIRKAREAAVLKGKGLKSNEEMIKNARKHGNPFGNSEVKDLEKLYCC